jgi:hypothetical protein
MSLLVISAGDEGSITALRNQPGTPTGSNADTVRSSNPGSKAPQRGIALPDFKMKTVSAALTPHLAGDVTALATCWRSRAGIAWC